MNIPPIAFLRRRVLARYHPSAFLLAAQLTSLMLYAALDGTPNGRAVISAFGVLILPLAVWVVRRSPAIRWIAWVIVVPSFFLSLLSAFGHTELVAWSALFEAALYFYTAGSLIAYMMEDHRVTTDELFAVGATFTLLAWGFGYLYLVCQAWAPDSFTGAVLPERSRTFIELLFMSFTNLTATGLGDVIPLTSTARVLVMLEQFVGVLYVAMVVSRLIGMSVGHRRRRKILGGEARKGTLPRKEPAEEL